MLAVRGRACSPRPKVVVVPCYRGSADRKCTTTPGPVATLVPAAGGHTTTAQHTSNHKSAKNEDVIQEIKLKPALGALGRAGSSLPKVVVVPWGDPRCPRPRSSVVGVVAGAVRDVRYLLPETGAAVTRR